MPDRRPPPPLLRAALAALLLALLASSTPQGRAADPVPYGVHIAPSGIGALDTAVHDSATLLSLRQSAPVGPFALVARARADRDRFIAALHSFGYYDGSVAITIAAHPLDDPALPGLLEEAPAKPDVPVEVTLTLGPLFRLGQVTLAGEVPAAARAALKLDPGQPAVAADVLAARERLLKALQDSGHALASVAAPTATLHPDARTLDVSFSVDAGPRVDLGPIAISGLRRTNEAYVRQRLMIHQGAPYNPDAIEKARQDLAGTGIFNTVRITPQGGVDAQGQLPMQVAVTEAPPRTVAFGGAYSTDLGGSLNANWTHHNLFGNGEQLSLTASATELGGFSALSPGYTLDAQLSFPDWVQRDQTLTLNALAERQYLIAYNQTAAILSAVVSRRLNPELTVSAGLSGEQESIAQEGASRLYTLLQTPLTVQFDNTHDLLNPTHGVRAGVNVTPTESFGNPDATFVIAQGTASTYLDFFGNGRSVLALRALAGTVQGASTFAVPADQRFYAGGSGTVRGFIYQSIGPQFPDGIPIGGTAIDAGTIEMRQRFGANYGAVAFVDAGQVNDAGVPFEGTPQVGVGVGARYYTSFGPIRLDVAVPVTYQPHAGSFELYIGIGQSF
jgi:translocation and assembly module TamA